MPVILVDQLRIVALDECQQLIATLADFVVVFLQFGDGVHAVPFAFAIASRAISSDTWHAAIRL